MIEQHCRYCGATNDLTRFNVQLFDRIEGWALCRDPYACLEREHDGSQYGLGTRILPRREVRT